MKESDGSFSEKTRRLITKRARGCCELCGLRIIDVGQYHHRKPRRMGGTSDPSVGSPANGLLLHPKCHRKVEENRLRSLHYGWVLNAGDDPEAVPVIIVGAWRLLSVDGSMVPAPDPAGPRVPSPSPDPDAPAPVTA